MKKVVACLVVVVLCTAMLSGCAKSCTVASTDGVVVDVTFLTTYAEAKLSKEKDGFRLKGDWGEVEGRLITYKEWEQLVEESSDGLIPKYYQEGRKTRTIFGDRDENGLTWTVATELGDEKTAVLITFVNGDKYTLDLVWESIVYEVR